MSTEGRKAIVRTGKAALAVAAPEAAIPAAIAERAVQAGKEVLTGDIIVVRKTENVGTKKHPIVKETETHYNAVSVGLGFLAVGVGAFLGAAAWEGFPLPWANSPKVKDNYARFLKAHPRLQERLRLNPPG